VAVVAFIMSWHEDRDGHGAAGERGRLAGFRRELYLSLGLRRDVLFEACDAALCKPGRVLMLAELCLEPECRRGHGGLYDALNCGEVRVARLRRALSGLPLPAWPDGRIRLAVDVSNWLRPDAATSPDRSFCHCYGRGKSSAQMIPGWPYSLVAALERGRTSWTLPLDAVRLRPDDDLAAVTAAQVRGVVTRLAAAGHWKDGDPDIMVIFDAGYEPARLAWLLRDLPVQVTGRLGTNRVFRLPPPPRVNRSLVDCLEAAPGDAPWLGAAQTEALLAALSKASRAELERACAAGERRVAALFRRTRADGVRAEARFDGLAGCLRTPAGGSSRQFLLDVDGGTARARLIGAREAARLMGLPDSYRLPARRNEAYHLLGDGVVAPVVRFLSDSLLLPLAEAGRSSARPPEPRSSAIPPGKCRDADVAIA